MYPLVDVTAGRCTRWQMYQLVDVPAGIHDAETKFWKWWPCDPSFQTPLASLAQHVNVSSIRLYETRIGPIHNAELQKITPWRIVFLCRAIFLNNFKVLPVQIAYINTCSTNTTKRSMGQFFSKCVFCFILSLNTRIFPLKINLAKCCLQKVDQSLAEHLLP